jgi:excisionase family DNA binding protein
LRIFRLRVRLAVNEKLDIIKILAKKLLVPTSEDTALAREALKSLIASTQSNPFKLQFQTKRASSESVTLPLSAVKLLMVILREMAAGDAVSLVPIRNEVTTQKAAEILNVSRPFLISLLEKHEIPARLVGSHRRIPLSPLLEYKRKTAAIREEALDQLAAEAQELKLY